MKKFIVMFLICILSMSILWTSGSHNSRKIYAEKKKIIVIDPGHQLKGNSSKEPIGPGSSVKKAKVTSGATGVATKVPEYEFNLNLSLKLKKAFEAKGFTVILVREVHDVNLSNIERAKIANDAQADLFLRIHADGSDNPKVNGISTIYPSSKNPYVSNLSEKSGLAALRIVNEMCLFTEAKNRGAVTRDDMTGINWSKVPVVIIECGFLSNAEEDKKLNTKSYQDKLVRGIVNGARLYFNEIAK